jgi:hypothetical protein
MPADSDPRPASQPVALPARWRPLGVRLAVIFFGSLLLLVGGFAWTGFDASVQAKFTPFQIGTIFFLFGIYGVSGWGLARCRVDATQAGLVVVNGFRRHQLGWAEVIAVRMPRGAPWASIDVSDGSTLAVMALQATDGERALRGVRALRSLAEAPPTSS